MIFFKKMFRISRTAWNFLLTWWNWLQNFPENILETPYLKSSMSVNVQISIFFCNSCIILTRIQLGKSIFSIFLVGNWCTVDDFWKMKAGYILLLIIVITQGGDIFIISSFITDPSCNFIPQMILRFQGSGEHVSPLSTTEKDRN